MWKTIERNRVYEAFLFYKVSVYKDPVEEKWRLFIEKDRDDCERIFLEANNAEEAQKEAQIHMRNLLTHLIEDIEIFVDMLREKNKFEGMTLKEAEREAAKEDMIVRVVCEDGKQYMVTDDYRTDRYNVGIINGKIVGSADIG